ncbi:ribulose-phosphate 3-epimerase [Candidatus Woesearchaeota archaeon]|nr:ribulose-phosphate 3-epimerase [Candidatus Woesearchaeota archaeon]MCF8013010.1 ribulose-phosphate 3-epimerase [Candidatus Woesearchaeota archaeon]
MQITPTVFSKNKKEFENRFKKISKLSREIQIDIMDGKFVKTKSINISDLPNFLYSGKIIEAHLMVKNPEKYIEPLRKKFVGRIIFHYETTKTKTPEIIENIHRHGMHAVMAINPETKLEKIQPYTHLIHRVLIMGVKPGKEKQKLLISTYKKIKELKQNNLHLKIQIDGGVNKETAKKLKYAGADILNTGSYVTNAKDPEKALKELKNI